MVNKLSSTTIFTKKRKCWIYQVCRLAFPVTGDCENKTEPMEYRKKYILMGSFSYNEIDHSADSSKELPDLYTTQTPASVVKWSEVHASVVTDWPPASKVWLRLEFLMPSVIYS